jgi:hypothetical protein
MRERPEPTARAFRTLYPAWYIGVLRRLEERRMEGAMDQVASPRAERTS